MNQIFNNIFKRAYLILLLLLLFDTFFYNLNIDQLKLNDFVLNF
jgi:hypothetical protein